MKIFFPSHPAHDNHRQHGKWLGDIEGVGHQGPDETCIERAGRSRYGRAGPEREDLPSRAIDAEGCSRDFILANGSERLSDGGAHQLAQHEIKDQGEARDEIEHVRAVGEGEDTDTRQADIRRRLDPVDAERTLREADPV